MLTDLQITGRFVGKFAVKCILKIPPRHMLLHYLDRETLMSAKQAINDKLQGIATYLKCGGLVNDQIKKGLLLSLRVKRLKSVFGKVTSKNVIVSCTLCAWPTHC